jgi:hypothetical protein
MYFKKFPKLFYDFKYADGKDTVLKQLTDITANVRVRKTILENITLYDSYDILDGETPEIIAEKVYGNPELHWVVMLANQRYDYIKDFPISSHELDDLVTEKYGETNVYGIHHYEKGGLQCEGYGKLKIPVIASTNLRSYDKLTTTGGCVARLGKLETSYVEQSGFYEYDVYITSGKFNSGELVNVAGVRNVTNSVTGIVTSVFLNPASTFTLGSNPFALNSAYLAITNYDHESTENEKKRTIKIISPRLIDRILVEIEDLLS